jgi:hypothetical protein
MTAIGTMIIINTIIRGHKNTTKATVSSSSLMNIANKNPTAKYAIAIPTAIKKFILTTP